MSINGISSSSNYMSTQNIHARQKPDPAKMAEDLFSKLDTKGQGYLEKTDLETAFGKISDSNSNSDSSSADQLFAKLDGNGDGKVTKDEMTSTLKQIASQLDGPFPRMRLQGQEGMQPPADGQKVDQGLTKDQLTAMGNDKNSPDSNMTNMFSQLASNFSTADTNSDGKVTRDEAMAYQQANSSNSANQSGSSSSSSSSSEISDQQFMRKMMQLLHAYGNDGGHSTGSQVSAAI
jgi:hypothetical protein